MTDDVIDAGDAPRSYLAAGLHWIGADLYHSDPCEVPSLSSTVARTIIDHSPRHAWDIHPRLNPRYVPEIKKTFDIGTAAHRAILGKGPEYVAYPDNILGIDGAASTKAAKEWAEEQRALGRVPLKSDEVNGVNLMRGVAEKLLKENSISFDQDRSEIVAIASVDGAICRAMIDNAPSDPRQPLWDFKTTTNAAPSACKCCWEVWI